MAFVADRITMALNMHGATQAVSPNITKAFNKVSPLHSFKSHGICGNDSSSNNSFLTKAYSEWGYKIYKKVKITITNIILPKRKCNMYKRTINMLLH